MSKFRVGTFHRDKVPVPLRAFCPIESANMLHDIALPELYKRGKRLVLLDVDNTLTHWRSEEISAEVKGWIDEAKNLGFKLCILSNTRHPERLMRLAASLEIPALRGRMKPSRRMFLEALEQFGTEAEAAIMIGDQLLTDVFGASRSGIEAIWVEPLGHREFKGTKISRWVERRLVTWLYNALATPIDAEPEAPALEHKKPFWERTLVKQLVKFGIVGGSSFVIDAGLSVLFTQHLYWHGRLMSVELGEWLLRTMPWLKDLPYGWFARPEKAGANPFFAIAALFAMLNSFIWNRRWTFETRGAEERVAQLRRFFVVSMLGYVIQLAIVAVVFGSMAESTGKTTTLAKAVGAAVAAFWNFGGQRLYAFRKKRQ